ncbi:EAL domain-containing protein [Bradyrhizobium sp. PMVTL-01]|uniref:EAL domain-containing protein n=1 Tax=Bradyrhizobium sp. PMVTL-01 TaxID=3434999 RepID=UPI003F6F4821
MPAELRAHSEVLLALSNGEKLGAFMLDGDKALRKATDFDKSSVRYPLRTTIRVERAVLSTWNSEVFWPAMALALALGVLFGILLSRTWGIEGPVADLDRALARGEFKPYFQPIFALRTGRIIGCEILVRWLREDGSVRR